MKKFSLIMWIFAASFMLIMSACSGGESGGGDSSAGSGTLSMSVTDAKPLLPEGATNLWVTFEEVLVHKSGASWISLPLVQTPYTIDLLQFFDGNTTELVPPTKLASGKYTQVRLVVSSATIRFDDGSKTEDHPVSIPSENLKTDKNFIIDVQGASAVDIVIHFDLSKSLVVTGPSASPSYKLKPVLHLFDDPLEAAIVEASIMNTAFGSTQKATVIVIAESNQEEYTKVEVAKSVATNSTKFSIFWLVPDQTYTITIDWNQDDVIDFEEMVEDIDLPAGAVFELNQGDPIGS